MADLITITNQERKDFFRKCRYVTKAPACIFLEGNRFSKKAKVLPIPIYAYAGIERGDFKKYLYEEETNGILVYYEWEQTDQFNDYILSMIPGEERELIMNNTSISSSKKDRKLFHQFFLKEVFEILNESKDYFKIKVWTEIPPHRGLNEGAAIASAVALLLLFESSEMQEERQGYLDELKMLRGDLQEEIIINPLFLSLWRTALILDFFSNGAAVFTSLLGCTKESGIIDYECAVYDELKDFFGPIPHSKKLRLSKIIRFHDYFLKCDSFYVDNLSTILFKWAFSKISFQEKERLGIALFKGTPNTAKENEFSFPIVNKKDLGLKDLGIKSNDYLKYYIISPSAFAILGDSFNIALCLNKPEEYVFEVRNTPFYYSVIYSSRRMGWGAEGVDVIDFKETKEIEEKEKYQKIEIDFSAQEEIRIDNKIIRMRTKKGIRQEYRLLEEILNRKGEIHWTDGFVLFTKWQKNVPKEGPVEQFRSVVSDLKRAVGINLLIPSNKENVRSWELNKDVHIESTIEKSETACKEAKKTDDLLRKAEELNEAFLRYPNSIEASKLLIDLAEKCNDSVTLGMDLENKKTDAVRLIRIREENLKSAIAMIKTKGLECEWKGDWQEVSEYLWLMIKECSEIEQYKIRGEGVLRDIRVDPDEARCVELISMIILIKGIDKDDRNFLRFIAEPEISDSIKFVSSKLFQKIADRKWPKEDYRDIKDRAMDFLWEGIKHWKHPDLKKTNELKNYLIANISYRLLEWFLEDRCAIPIEKQRDLWHLENVRRKLKKKLGSSPSVEEQLKELGPKWDRSRIEAVLGYEGNISGFVDIDKYYEYFDEIEFDLEDILAILEREN